MNDRRLIVQTHDTAAVAAPSVGEKENPRKRDLVVGELLRWVRENKFWMPVARINDAYGDRSLV